MVSDTWGGGLGHFPILSENVCIPHVSANSVLVLLYVAVIRLGHRIMS